MVTTKKAAAKKTAAKKTAAPRKTAEPAPTAAVKPADGFPLPDGHYFSTPVVSRRSVSSGAHVARLREALDVGPGSAYDDDVAEAVGAWQQDHDLPYTRVVDSETWDSIFR